MSAQRQTSGDLAYGMTAK